MHNQASCVCDEFSIFFTKYSRIVKDHHRRGEYGKPNVAIFNSSNFIFSFVLYIQLFVQYSTCIQHSTRFLTFNNLFNFQHVI